MPKKLKIDLTKIRGKYGFKYCDKFKNNKFGTISMVYKAGSPHRDDTGFEITVSFEPKTGELHFDTSVFDFKQSHGDIMDNTYKVVKVHSQKEAETVIHNYMKDEVYD